MPALVRDYAISSQVQKLVFVTLKNDRYITLEETVAIDETIKIEDIDWNVDEGIVDGERFVLTEYTNNSPLV